MRWHVASSFLTDFPENIQCLPPGATPPQMDLSGDLRNVAEVYRRIPSERLIVLGRAGSGKSILTIRFVLDFLETRAPRPGAGDLQCRVLGPDGHRVAGLADRPAGA
ncbi:hypothetical protein NKH18_00740 [Streptomyces sp. M10(2022)]